MRHQNLQSDDLPLPDKAEVLSRIEITSHAKKRFKERSRSDESLSVAFLWERVENITLTRHSPEWRKEPDSPEFYPDLFLLFPFLWHDGVMDEGCLLIKRKIYEGEDRNREDSYVAKTFISEQSNNPEYYLHLPKPSNSLLRKVSKTEHCSIEKAADLLLSRPQKDPPAWIKTHYLRPHALDTKKSARHEDAWLQGKDWAVSLHAEEIGSHSPYNYTWERFYSRKDARKTLSRKRYLRRHKRSV